MSKKIKVYAGFLTNGTIVDTQPAFIRDTLEVYKDKVELVYPSVHVRRIFHDYARNAAVEEFLASDCDAIWFLDSDVTPPKYIFDLIAVHWDKWKVAGACYPIFMTYPGSGGPEVLTTAYEKDPRTGNLTMGKTPTSGTAFVDGLATGCLFIKREVFDLLKKPYFEFKFDSESRTMTEGEDLGFIRKLNELNIKTFTDFALICRHQKTVDLLDVNNYAMAYARRAIEDYDTRVIKPHIHKAILAAKQAGYNQAKKELEKPKSTLWVPK